MDRVLRLVRRYILWFIIDYVLTILAFYLAFSMRFVGSLEPRISEYQTVLNWVVLPIALVYCLANYLFGIYRRIWRHESAEEIVLIFEAAGITTAALVLWDVLRAVRRPLPISVVILGGFFAFCSFAGVRYRRRLVQRVLRQGGGVASSGPRDGIKRRRVLIVGAGQAGQVLISRFNNQEEGREYEVVGFVDDDPARQGMRVLGLDVLGGQEKIPHLVSRCKIDLIVIAMYDVSGQDFRAILSLCQETPAQIKVLPNLLEFIKEDSSVPLLRDITVEDLVGRKPVEIDQEACQSLLGGKRVLVTGAAGSIGSELCRQITTFAPRQLLMLDNNESGLYVLGLEISDLNTCHPQFPISNLQSPISIIGDVTNQPKMQAMFEQYRPHIVFHAAAYKHVPLMEEHPDEAVRVNVLGSLIVGDLACRYGADRFVFISTDKAVKPTSVMGATKRIGEMLASSMVQDCKTLCTAVRFGNVLGSRGSVVPTFVRQIEMGSPVTLTHPEMTRYFMSVSEAVSLVIQAAAMTEGDDLFLLDMGEQIRIEELAHRLIRLRGLRPGVDVPIKYIGVRPGEKLREELIGDGEEKHPTSHPAIFRIQSDNRVDKRALYSQIEGLASLAEEQRNGEIVARLQEMVGLRTSGQAAHAIDQILAR